MKFEFITQGINSGYLMMVRINNAVTFSALHEGNSKLWLFPSGRERRENGHSTTEDFCLKVPRGQGAI